MNAQWVKNPKWTWKNNVIYAFIMPFQVLKRVIDWISSSDVREEFGLFEIVDLAHGEADMRCGRWWLIEETQKK